MAAHFLRMLAIAGVADAVWPPPRSISHAGDASAVDAQQFRFEATCEDDAGVLRRAMARYEAIVRAAATKATAAPSTVAVVRVVVEDCAAALGADTSYDYAIANATISAASVFGAAHGLETFAQLVAAGELRRGTVVRDGPAFAWRGAMLDSGRRFAPVAVVEDLLDVMGAAKMSVLHWHLSARTRRRPGAFYPNPVALAGLLPVERRLRGLPRAHGKPRGRRRGVLHARGRRGRRRLREGPGHPRRARVRRSALRPRRVSRDSGWEIVTVVLGRFDVPGHTYGMRSLGGELTFCKGSDWTIDGDAASIAVLKALVAEMAALFDDDVFHLGMDEVSEPPPCTADGTRTLEAALLAHVEALGKTPMGWDPVAAVAKPGGAIVDSWLSNAGAAAFADKGFDVVDAANAPWYFTHPAGWDASAACRPGGCAGPPGWATAWRRPGGASNSSHVLGGEFSLWTDDYAFPGECGAHGAAAVPANASCMMDRALDAAFRASLGGLAWPRGLVAAAAFYGYDAALDAASPNFTAAVYAFNDQLAARGFRVCKSGAVCSYVSEDDALYPGIVEVEGYNCSAQIVG